MATVDADGVLTGTYITGPFGEKLQQTTPTNATDDTTYNYVGKHQKPTESTLSLQPIQMGARVYLPELGRFLQVDPVEGGTLNNYVYAMDPVNQWDLSGKFLLLIIPTNPIINNLPKPTKRSSVPGILGGYLHWLFGRGSPLKVRSDDITWKFTGKKPKVGKYKKTTVSAQATGKASDVVGRVSASFTGTVEKTKQGYRARGKLTPRNDVYDFNDDPTRGGSANLHTGLGAFGGGFLSGLSGGRIQPTAYDIVFEGSVYIDESW